MGKRKLQKKREKIEKKFKKLNKKLRTMEANSNSSDSEMSNIDIEDLSTNVELNEGPLTEQVEVQSPQASSPPVVEVVEIEEGLLNALGTVEKPKIGPTAHIEIAQRWTPILTKGLPRDVKTEIINKYTPFENIPMLPPKLNPEIIVAVSEPVKRRDAIIVERQKQVGVALTAIGQSLQLCLQNGDKVEIIKNMNNAAKILCDTIHIDTNSRRSLIAAVVNKDMKDSLTGEADSFLFGSNLLEKIKSTKAVLNSVRDLKNTAMVHKTQNKTKPLNWRAPLRPSARTVTGGERANHPLNHARKDEKKSKRPFRSNNQLQKR